MYSIIKNVIESGRYELSSMLTKIDTIWVQGNISDDEKQVLIELAKEKADYTLSIDIITKINDLENRVRALENGETSGEPSEEPSEEYPSYVVGKWYYNGDLVSFEGKKYKCIAPQGQVCTWSPKEYPNYWEEVLA